MLVTITVADVKSNDVHVVIGVFTVTSGADVPANS